MMNNIRQWLFTPNYSYNRIDLQRAQGLLMITLMVILSTFIRVAGEYAAGNLGSIAVVIPPLLAVAAGATIYLLVHRGQLMMGAWLLIGLLLLGAIILNVTGINHTRVIFLMLPITVAAGLLKRRSEIALVSIAVVMIGIVLTTQQTLISQVVENSNLPQLGTGTDFQIFLVGLVLLTMIIYLLIFPMREMITRTQEQADALQKIVDFGVSVLDRVETLEMACAETILFIRNKLGYPFAQVFLVGGKGVLNQRIRTGLSSEFTSRDDITLGDLNAIQQSAANKQPVMVSDKDIPVRIGHFLPATKHGLCLPFSDHEGVVGVLDIQSSTTPFSEEEQNVLNAAAAYLGAAISDIRLIEALRNNIRQQEEVAEKLRQRIQEMHQYNATSGSNSFDAYLRQRGQGGLGMEMRGGVFTPAGSIPESLLPVLKDGALLVQNQDNVKIINIPINLHGEIIGAMSFTVPKERVLTERQLDTAQIVANRLALAIENKRLVEQTRAQAVRERKANETASLLLSATNVDAVMNLAVQSFNEALGAINTRIHLQPAALMETEREKV